MTEMDGTMIEGFTPQIRDKLKAGFAPVETRQGTAQEILLYPEEWLSRPSAPIKSITPEIRHIVDDMQATMWFHNGMGLAAVQIGHPLRIVVTRVQQFQNPNVDDSVAVFINPVVVEVEGEVSSVEGCLSIPGARARVSRAEKVVVDCMNLDGVEHRVTANGWAAIVLQHEIDHLNGKLFLDHLKPLSRQMALKKHRKEMEKMWRKAKREATSKVLL